MLPFDRLTMTGHPELVEGSCSAFHLPFVLRLSKEERFAQDRLVEA
jgi:hypothetical protein